MCERGRGEAAERRRRCCVRALSRLGDLLSWVPGTPMCARPLSSGGDHQIIIRARRGRAAIVGLCD